MFGKQDNIDLEQGKARPHYVSNLGNSGRAGKCVNGNGPKPKMKNAPYRIMGVIIQTECSLEM